MCSRCVARGGRWVRVPGALRAAYLVAEALDAIASTVARALARASQLDVTRIAAVPRVADTAEIVRTDAVRLASRRTRGAMIAIPTRPPPVAAVRRQGGGGLDCRRLATQSFTS